MKCSSEALQLQRLQSRNSLSADEARSRLAAQAPLSSKLVYADYVIDNSGPIIELEHQVERVVGKLNAKAGWDWRLSWFLPPVGIIRGALRIAYRLWFKGVYVRRCSPGVRRLTGHTLLAAAHTVARTTDGGQRRPASAQQACRPQEQRVDEPSPGVVTSGWRWRRHRMLHQPVALLALTRASLCQSVYPNVAETKAVLRDCLAVIGFAAVARPARLCSPAFSGLLPRLAPRGITLRPLPSFLA